MQHSQPSSVQKFTARLAASRFFTISLIFHIALISILGTVVMFKAASRPPVFDSVETGEPFLEEPIAEQVPETPTEFEEPTVAPQSEAAPSSASAISTLSQSSASWSTSASMDQLSAGTTLSAGKPFSSSTGSPTTSTSTSARMKGSLYGVPIDANKLGVIMDVSGSAHGTLLFALKELDKFRGAEIVLYPGCGMGAKSRSSDYEIKSAKSVADRFEKDEKNEKVVFGQIGKWIAKNPHDDNRIKKLLKSPDVYVSVNDDNTQQTAGCNFAFERLIKDGVDTIYWFADFADGMDAKVAEDLAQKLKNKHIKVIAHNFAGKPVRPEAMIIVEKTGGQAISKIPGKN